MERVEGLVARTQDLRQAYPALRRFAAVVGPDEIEPDDLVHDALVATLRRHSWEELDDPVAYVRRVIVNLSANHRRRFGRARAAFERVALGRRDVASDEYPSDLDQLSALSPLARAVVFLHHVEGRTYAEIAGLLGLTETNARVVSSRALRALRHHGLEEER